MKSSESAIHGKSNPLYDSHDSLEKSWYPSNNSKRQQVRKAEASRTPSVLLFLGLITDILLLLFVIILEYFLRCSVEGVFYESKATQAVCHDLWKNIFPIRKSLFSCTDQQLNYSSSNVTDFDQFFHKANISSDVIYWFTFLTPIFVFVICELLLYGLMPRQEKSTVNTLCKPIHIPFVLRRLYRFITIFLFGALALMLLVDVVKLFVGRLRPTFFSICRPNCEVHPANMLLSDNYCNETRAHVLKDARSSFPSLHSALAMYTAITIMIYLHAVSRIQHGKYLLIPFVGLTTLLFAICCGLSRHGHNHNWWTDVLAGQAAGMAMAFYMGFCVSKGYKYHKHVSNRKLQLQIDEIVAQRCRGSGTKEWHTNKLGYFNADSLYNLRGSSTELRLSALCGGTSTGYHGTHLPCSSALPRNTRAEAAATLVGERTPPDSNQKIIFRQSRCSSTGLTYLSTGNAATGSPAGATITHRGSIGTRNSLRNSRTEAIPVPLLSISSTSSTGLQNLANPSQQS